MVKKQKHINRPWISVDVVTKQIKATGICNCGGTLAAMPVAPGCELIEFVGGIKGQYFVDGEMVSSN
ncbi:MAG: hypothetical protein GY818_07045 [Planctomycetaceae bacterium]|nr:hypothetical protein [Planctomycetaceae bacterium]